jgi:thymidylate kinase
VDRENVFERRAQKILEYLKRDLRYDDTFLPRPFFVEVTGPPSSGKTTTITELDKFFRRQGFRVLRPQEGAEVIRHIERTTPLYNIRTGLYALSLLIDIAHGHQYDLVIFDRCIFDANCWMIYWEEKGMLTKAEKLIAQQFFLSRFWADTIDIAYFMICDPDIAMKRELRIALSEKLGETTNPKTVATLRERYVNAYHALSPTCPQLRLVDTSHLEEGPMVEQIANYTLDMFEQKIKAAAK